MTDDRPGGADDIAGDFTPTPRGLVDLPNRERAQSLEIRQLFAEQEHGLRQRYGDWLLWLLGAQFLIADAAFVAFAWVGQKWAVPPGVIEFWLAATVVQVVGVVAIVARHLFPSRNEQAAAP
jgi:glutathione S-transferase